MTTASAAGWGVVALGAGLVHLALAAGAPLAFALVAAGLGLAEVAVGLAMIARGSIIAPRAIIAVGVLPGVAAFVLGLVARSLELAVLGAALRPVPIAVASLLGFALALGAAFSLRQARTRPSGHRASPIRSLIALSIAAVAVSGVVTPALAASRAGEDAVPHGEHGRQPSPASPVELHDPHSGH